MKSADERFAEADRLEEIGDNHRALAVWRELAESYPDPAALCRLGRLARELGETEESVNALRRAIKLDPTLGVAYVALASMARDEGNYEDAEHLLRQALRIEKTNYGYCMLHGRSGQHGNLRKLYQHRRVRGCLPQGHQAG